MIKKQLISFFLFSIIFFNPLEAVSPLDRIAGIYNLEFDELNGVPLPENVDSGVTLQITSSGVSLLMGADPIINSFTEIGEIEILSHNSNQTTFKLSSIVTIKDPEAVYAANCEEACIEYVIFKGAIDHNNNTLNMNGVGIWVEEDFTTLITSSSLYPAGQNYFTVKLSGVRNSLPELEQYYQNNSIPLPVFP